MNARAQETNTTRLQVQKTATAIRVDRPAKLDGTLDDPLWKQALLVSNFLQREPFEGQSPMERTEVRILYTKHAVYFGIECFDSNSTRIIATELRRDVPQELDDYFEIVIDSSHDRRNAHVFQINPLGTQRDALITEEQRTDPSLGMAILVGTAFGLRKPEPPKRFRVWKPSLIVHDFRRSAARNLVNAGVPIPTAMAITGHTTDSTFRRYAIVSEDNIVEAGRKIGAKPIAVLNSNRVQIGYKSDFQPCAETLSN